MKKFLLTLLLLLVAVTTIWISTSNVGITSIPVMLNTLLGRGIATPPEADIQQRLQAPPGFSVGLYAGDLPNARFLRFTGRGDLLVSRPHKGDVVLLRPAPGNPHVAGERKVVIQGLSRPSGLELDNGWLYIGESNAIGRIRFDEVNGTVQGDYEQIITGLTDDGNHPYKTIRFGPDNKLYLSQGSTCNVCLEKNPRRATISRFEPDGSGEERVATGIRNSLGMDWSPWDGALYVTDNGRDLLGDDYPPCELNRVEDGGFYGWPYFNGNNEPDPDFNELPEGVPNPPTSPVHEFPAHNAPLGLTFVDTGSWPKSHGKVALAALHGSWNRSTPDGYRVVSLHWVGEEITRRDFLYGFEQNGDIIGRPVDVVQGPDGAVYVSDDYAGAIYRVSPGEGDSSTRKSNVSPTQPFTLQDPDWLNQENRDDLWTMGQTLFEDHQCEECHNTPTATGNMALGTLNERRQYSEVIGTLEQPPSPMPLFPLEDIQKRALAVYLLNKENKK